MLCVYALHYRHTHLSPNVRQSHRFLKRLQRPRLGRARDGSHGIQVWSSVFYSELTRQQPRDLPGSFRQDLQAKPPQKKVTDVLKIH